MSHELPETGTATAACPVPRSTATQTDEPDLVARCEHSKLNTGDADPLGDGVWQLQLNAGYSRSTAQWDDLGKDRRRAGARETAVETV